MANEWVRNGLKHFGLGDVVWKAAAGSSVKATLYDAADYTYVNTHEYMNLDTMLAAAKTAVSAALTLIDAAIDGILDCADFSWSSVTGDESEGIMFWKDGGGGGTSQSGTTDLLLVKIDTATGLAVLPNGGNINVTIDSGANKLAAL